MRRIIVLSMLYGITYSQPPTTPMNPTINVHVHFNNKQDGTISNTATSQSSSLPETDTIKQSRNQHIVSKYQYFLMAGGAVLNVVAYKYLPLILSR